MATQEVARALQVAWGAQRPRSYGGKWGGFTGDYEELELKELQKEALCEGEDLMTDRSRKDRSRPRRMGPVWRVRRSDQKIRSSCAPFFNCSKEILTPR